MILERLKEKISLNDIISFLGTKEGFYCLDSGNSELPRGRYSYVGIKPEFSIYCIGDSLFLRENNKVRALKDDIFTFIRAHLGKRKVTKKAFPFNSGFIGYITYDFGWNLDKFNRKKMLKRVLNLPLIKFNYYSEVLVYDHKFEDLYYINEKDNKDWKDILKFFKKVKSKKEDIRIDNLRSSFSYRNYEKAILKTKDYIKSGDIYQANISQRFSVNASFNPVDFYLKLREISPAPFGAYLRDPFATVVCNSPERFLYKKGRYIETCPIKGTRKRYFDKEKDLYQKKELRKSQKDRAEHIMIVDLERNDLGKICEIGSVKVKKLFSIESYANVHHMVSIVYGKLKKSLDITDCIKATFPGGSITGAPKLRSMEIIDELEPVSRGIYCGSIGYIDNSGDADFNIAIRTGVITRGKMYFYVGGGIVADSEPKLEYEETITKAKAFLSALNLSEIKEL